MFIDRARFEARAGRGGDGCISFLRASGKPRGGPDGGDGGDGGSVILRATKRRPTLADVARRPIFRAPDGVRGRPGNKTGKSGKDVLIEVPVGTIIREGEDPDGPIVKDLTFEGEEFVLARGGRGGQGNVRFATALLQAPRVATRGEPGAHKVYTLELKLIAQVGLVGLPNAGKSTFLRRVSLARPKVGSYPFTTLRPYLGVASLDDVRKLVIADLPGLIEGAHAGVGLGDEFLRHVERCRVILHLVDGTAGPDAGTPSPLDAYKVIRAELRAYDAKLADKPEVVALNKCDALAPERFESLARDLEAESGRRVFRISGVAGTNLDQLLEELARIVAEVEASEAPLIPAAPRVVPHAVYDLEGQDDEEASGPPPLD